MEAQERNFSHSIFRRFAQLRLITGAICVTLGLQFLTPNLLSDFQAFIISVTGLASLFGAAFQIALLRRQRQRKYSLAIAYFFILLDCGIYGTLTALGTIAKGYGAFLVLPVLAGALTLRHVHAYIAPAMISMGILIYSGNQILLGRIDIEQLSRNASLGAILFFVALITHIAARRIASAESRAKHAEVDTENLEKISQQIIQQLPQGLICVDPYDRIIQANTLAKQAIPKLKTNGYLGAYSEVLAEQLRHWRHTQDYRQATLQIDNEKWRCEFQAINDSGNITLILLDSETSAKNRERAKRLAGLGQLTAAIAHEIRNPLSAIMQAGELLQQENGEAANDNPKLTRIIASNGHRLNTIVDNILQLTRHKQLENETVLLNEWLKQYLDAFNGYQKPSSQIAFDTNVLDTTSITISSTHFSQILDNLCGNAISYGSPPFSLRAKLLPHHQLEVVVADHGSGIPNDISSQAFEPFITSSGRGTGLGLYICQELARINHLKLRYREPSKSQPRCEFAIIFNLPGEPSKTYQREH